MVYKIIDIEGVGEVYAEKLIAAGIKDTDALLAKCAKPAGRKALEEETGITGKLILKWANHSSSRGGENGSSSQRTTTHDGILKLTRCLRNRKKRGILIITNCCPIPLFFIVIANSYTF